MKVEGKDYEKELQRLREQRNFHRKEFDRLNKEMDDLESDSRIPLDDYVEKFVKLDKRKDGGYIYWFKIQSPYKKKPRGIYFKGIGFIEGKSPVASLHIISSLNIEWNEIDELNIIEEKEYMEAIERVKSDIFNVLEFKAPYKEPDMWKGGFLKNER